jgi:hypothetical protein
MFYVYIYAQATTAIDAGEQARSRSPPLGLCCGTPCSRNNRPIGPSFAILSIESLIVASAIPAPDGLFVYKDRAIELKDGDPLNELMVLYCLMMNRNGVMCADKMIRLDPGISVLNCEVDNEIILIAAHIALLSPTFLAEIEKNNLLH